MKSPAISVPLVVLGILFLVLAIVAQIGPIGFPGDSHLFSVELDQPVASAVFFGAALLLTGIAVEVFPRRKK
jgi:hypothetical protein